MNPKQKKTLLRIIISAVLTVAAMIVTKIITLPWFISLPIFLVPYLLAGYDILLRAAKNISHGQIFDENFLMAVATIGAFALQEFSEGVFVMVFYQTGELFQSVAVGKSRRSIAGLMDIRPDTANVITANGDTEEADPDDVEIGTLILVRPGERVPIDGVVVEGFSTMDTSALTGESVPRECGEGDEIISGWVSLDGCLTVRTTKEFGESTVSRILDLVENSSMKKARMENFITRFAKYYTPTVCFAALAIAVLPPLVLILSGSSPGWSGWIERALTFLVISCPCALVISVPLSFFGGIGCASSNGILVKGSNYLEALANADYVVFDKTGTLTKGSFCVTDVCPADGVTSSELLEMASCAESASSHPVALAIRQACKAGAHEISGITERAGCGVTANVDGRKIAAGNVRLMELEGVADVSEISGKTVVHVSSDGRYLGYICAEDSPKENVKQTLEAIRAEGVKRTIMLTGDDEAAARAVAKEIGIDEYHARLLPDGKVELVEKLLAQKSEKEKLAFVGDGINDAPVLSRADIGIAMGAMGSDAAIEAADIVLMDDDLSKIPLAIRIARRTLAIVKQNVVGALAVKFVCLVLGALGLASMWLAIFADVGVMVIAVLNATRALRIKK